MIWIFLSPMAVLGILGIRLERKYARLFPRTTDAPARAVVLFDGQCVFCRKQVENLKRMLGAKVVGQIDFVSFQDEGVLARFPGITHDACMEGMVTVDEQGRVHVGVAGASILLARRIFLARAYFLPVVRQIADGVYALIAANRYRLMGKAVAAGECDGGSCALHVTRNRRTTI